MRRSRRWAPEAPPDPRSAVDAILGDPRVVWFPIRHYSPVCAWQLARTIRELRPAAVLVEGPDDATPLIEHIVDPATRPPLTILSTVVDHKNRFGLNGVLSAKPELPARLRAWWPLVGYGPEYVALRVGAEVGADLAFIDAPLPATIPFTHGGPRARRSTAVDDLHLAESRWFAALGSAGRLRSFEEFWQARFEVGGASADPLAFRRAVLLFAWCTRHLDADPQALEADGTLLRERHMRHHVDRVLKAVDGPVVVVVGAYHAVALPTTKGKRAAARADRATETVLCAHSYRALARLYDLNPCPAWGDAVWRALEAGGARPFLEAATRLLVALGREGRREGLLSTTADAVGAVAAAEHLARLRGHPDPTRLDLADAAEAAFVKGDRRREGVAVAALLQQVLVGHALGEVTAAAGQLPLLSDYQAEAARLRLDLSGASKVVRCDVLRQEKHREKSCFLHRCAWLELPMFEALEDRRSQEEDAFYRGPDVVRGEGLHLITETWGVRWTEQVDDRLLELSHLGPSIASAAAAKVEEELPAAESDASLAGRVLLRCAQMGLDGLVGRALRALRSALATDASFVHLTTALDDLVLLHGMRDALVTAGDPRLVGLLPEVHVRACLALPGVAGVADDEVEGVLQALTGLLSHALTAEVELDRELLAERAREVADDGSGASPAVRGACHGVLLALGASWEQPVRAALDRLTRGPTARVLETGRFLEGLFMTCRGAFLRSGALAGAVDDVLRRVDWPTFKLLLPDLRRAFTRFIPMEIDTIARGVQERLSSDEPVAGPSEAVARLAALVDQRATAQLARHGLQPYVRGERAGPRGT